MADRGIKSSVLQVAGAGFRLSLLLNAIGVQLDRDIQKIAKEISLFSLMLKQVGQTLQEAESIASQAALDTANEITAQSRTVFHEVNEMMEMSQQRDGNGQFQSITIAQRVKWCFKKQRVQYLLGQLETLKLSLAIMLQILQLGKTIAAARRDPSKPLPKAQDMLQERAEIQNMVVVRHWSSVDLRRLYQLAEEEVVRPTESPPPSYQSTEFASGDPRLSIKAPELEANTSQALVKYHELPLSQLDASLNKAMYRPNRILHASDGNEIDHLLDEWTRIREIEPRSRHRSHKYRSRYDTDEEDDSHLEFERSDDIGGLYIGGPTNGARSVKNVRFRAQMESDSEDSDNDKPQRGPPRRHILRSNEDSSSLSSSSSDSTPLSTSRRSSGSSAASRGPNEQNSTCRRYTPPTVQNSNAEIQPGRPSSRGGPPSPTQARPLPVQGQSWQGQYANAGLRPHQPHMPPAPHRTSSVSSYGMPAPVYGSPNPQVRPFYPPPPPPGQPKPQHAPRTSQRPRHRPPREKRQENKSSLRDAKKDVKRGLIGAGAVAGLMDILSGLGAI
ncbi:hypothetical protein MMC22_009829 [Lobaria immixta]|nr:hypothetical protein [Lobaria immixta]